MRQWTGWELVMAMPIRRQTITWTNADSLSIGTLGTNVQWNLNQSTIVFIQKHAFKNVVCEMDAILSGGDELRVGNQSALFWISERSHIITIVFLPCSGILLKRDTIRRGCSGDNMDKKITQVIDNEKTVFIFVVWTVSTCGLLVHIKYQNVPMLVYWFDVTMKKILLVCRRAYPFIHLIPCEFFIGPTSGIARSKGLDTMIFEPNPTFLIWHG